MVTSVLSLRQERHPRFKDGIHTECDFGNVSVRVLSNGHVSLRYDRRSTDSRDRPHKGTMEINLTMTLDDLRQLLREAEAHTE